MKKINNYYLNGALILIIFIYVSDIIPKINNFEDELIALTSHFFFLTELEFKAPFLVDEMIFTPALTTGFNSSIGGAFGWIIFKDFYFSRLFNFIWLVFEISLFNFYLYKKNLINIKFFYFSLLGIFCIPLWYNSLYGLGEILSSIIFFNSLLLYEKNSKISMFLMSISIFYGKFIIFLSFLVLVVINIRKLYFKNILYFAIPPSIWALIISIKIGFSGLLDYINRFFGFLFFHGLPKSNYYSNFFQKVRYNIGSSEIADWSIATLIRVVFIPLILVMFLLIRRMLKKHFKHDFLISIVIFSNYLYFFLFSNQKYLRYSQTFLVITIFYLLYLLSNEENLSLTEKFAFVFMISIYFSSEILIILLLLSLILSYRKNTTYIFLFIFLLMNIVNLQYESRNYLENNLNLHECKNSISSIECIKTYLPYEYNIVDN